MSKRGRQVAANAGKRLRLEEGVELGQNLSSVCPLDGSTNSETEVGSRESNAQGIEQLTNVMREVFAKLGNASGPASSSGFKGDALPHFDPEDGEQNIVAWCKKVEELRDVFHWSEDAMIYHALSKLRGLAETWYSSLPTIKYTWEEWKNKLIRAFPSARDYAEQLDEMMRRKKGHLESYTRYYYEKLALINACQNISGQNAVSCIIHGLQDDHVKTAARAGNYAEPEDLFIYLRTINTNNSFRPREAKYNNRMSSNDKGRGKTLKENAGSRCFRCNKVGHKQKYCMLAEKKKICNFCKKIGHEEERCFAKRDNRLPAKANTTL